MLERTRFSSQVKLPQLEISHSCKHSPDNNQFNLPVSSGDAQFISFRMIGEKNPQLAFQKQATDNSVLNQSVIAELEQKKRVKGMLDQTLYKFKSDHQEEQINLQKKIKQIVKMQKNIKRYPQKIDVTPTYVLKSPTAQKKVAFSSYTTSAYWYKTESSWLPQVRESSMAAVYGKSSYFFGGIGSEVMADMIEYDLSINKFKDLSQRGDIPMGRYGHCLHAITYQMGVTLQYSIDNFSSTPLTGRYLIMFGGELQFNSQLRLRENLSDTRLFNIDNNQWILLKPNLECIPESRRSFGSCLIGKGLLIHGGIKSRFQILQDMHYLNLGLCKWQPIQTTGHQQPYPQGLAFQSLISIYQKPYQLFDKKDFRTQKLLKLADYEGVYCFGGCYMSQDKSTSFYSHFLAILKVDTLTWVIPECVGKCPSPRIQHSATYLQDSNLVIIFGGRDDQNKNPYYNDVYAYKIVEKEWITLEVHGDVPNPRASHISFGYKTKLYVMGGVNLKGYQYQGIQIAELNPSDIRALLQTLQGEEKQQQQKQQQQQQTQQSQSKRQSILKAPQISIQNVKSQQPPTSVSDRSQKRLDELKQLSFQNFNKYKK